MKTLTWKTQKICSAALLHFLVATLGLLPFSYPILFRTSQLLAQTLNPQKAEADNLIEQGKQQHLNRQFQAAIQSFKKALSIYQQINDNSGKWTALYRLGESFYAQRDYNQAIEYYQQSLTVAQEIPNFSLESTSLNGLGFSFYKLNDNVQAIDYFEQSLIVAQKDPNQQENQQDIIFILTLLGNLYLNQGNNIQAIDYFEKSLTIAQNINNFQSESRNLSQIGFAFYLLNDYAQAIDHFKKGLTIAQEINDYDLEISALNGLGQVYSYLGDYDEIIGYFEQSLSLSRETKDRATEALVLVNLGDAYFDQGEWVEAKKYFEEALQIAREIDNQNLQSVTLSGLGRIYSQRSDHDKAIKYLQQSLAIANDIDNLYNQSAAFNNLGLVYYYQGEYTKAVNYFQKSLAISEKTDEIYGQAQSLNYLGLAFFKSGNFVEAEKNLFSGIKALESIREKLGSNDEYKVSLFETQVIPYITLQQVLIAQNKPEVALEIAERGRAKAFVDLLLERISPEVFEQITIEPPNIQKLKKIAQKQDATLVEYSIIYDDFNLKKGKEFKESELFIWVMTSNGQLSFRRVDLKPLWQKQNTSLQELVANSRKTIGVKGRGSFDFESVDETSQQQQLQQLYQFLIQPIAELLPTKPSERVVFIPNRALFLAPFPALQDREGKYLIEKHSILSAPAIQVLGLTHQQKQKTDPADSENILIVGNPTMPKLIKLNGQIVEELSELPGAESEAIAIAKLFDTKAIIGDKATKSSLVSQMPKAKIIHLATHGLLEDIKGLGVPGAIALAPSNNDEGFLTVNEILAMKLNADLVVLSACDTGLGNITGDGVIGLSRSLFIAGTSSVIVSLWKVPDAPTAFLMTEFYRNLEERGLDKAQSLRQAMLTTKEQYPKPINWSAFTLIGEAL